MIDARFYNPSVPLNEFIGIVPEEVEAGHARMLLPFGEHLRSMSSAEPLHGSIAQALAGMACGAALVGAFDQDTSVPMALESHTRLSGQPRAWPVTADARIVHKGRQAIFTECEVADAGGYVIVRSSITWAVVSTFGGVPKRT